MKNAYAGIKKIYYAEIIQLIAVILMLASVILLAIAGAKTNTENAVIGAVLFFAGLIIELIAFIMSILGIRKASMDEPIIKKAFYFVLAAIAAGVVEAVFSENSMISNIAAAAGDFFSYCSTFFVLSGIVSIAEKRSSSEVSAKAKSTRKRLMRIMILTALLRVLSGCAEWIPQENIKLAIGTVTVILVLVSLVLEVIQFFIYLDTLLKTKKLLEAK